MAFDATGDERRADAQRRALDALGGLLPTAGAEPAPAGDPEGWVSVADAAEAAGVSTSTIRYWYRHGSIPTQRAEGDGGRYLVPLEAVLARANRLGETDEASDDDIDMDAVYWSAECEKARHEAEGLRAELDEARVRVGVLERRVAELQAELDSLEIIEDDAVVPEEPRGYRGPARPQDPNRELVFDDEVSHLALPAGPADEVDEVAPEEAPGPEIAFDFDPSVFEDDVIPSPEKKRRR